MSRTALVFVEEDLRTEQAVESRPSLDSTRPYLSHNPIRTYDDEDDEDEKGWSNRSVVEEEEDEEQPDEVLETLHRPTPIGMVR